jgi:hypothetical protein
MGIKINYYLAFNVLKLRLQRISKSLYATPYISLIHPFYGHTVKLQPLIRADRMFYQ